MFILIFKCETNLFLPASSSLIYSDTFTWNPIQAQAIRLETYLSENLMPFTIQKELFNAAVKVIETQRFPDDRGFFMESYSAEQFKQLGISKTFIQDNHSCSQKGVLRGLHFQWNQPMAKLMRVTSGAAFLVAVDIRHNSPTLGQWVGIEASAENGMQLWAEEGFVGCAVAA